MFFIDLKKDMALNIVLTLTFRVSEQLVSARAAFRHSRAQKGFFLEETPSMRLETLGMRRTSYPQARFHKPKNGDSSASRGYYPAEN